MRGRSILATAAAGLFLASAACGGGGGGGTAGSAGDASFSSETTIAPSTTAPTGATYYVSPGGRDSNDGLSATTPWKTLRKAASVLRAGDTLLLRGGKYVDDYFRPLESGRRDNPITIKAYPNELPIITGRPTYNTYFHLIDVEWVIIDGLHFANTSSGTQIWTDDSSFIIIRNSTFSDHGGGTMINIGRGGHVLIEHNTFDTTGSPKSVGSGDHIYIMGSSHNVIQHNYFKKAGHYAIDLINYGPAEDRIFSTYNVIRHNTIEQHWGGGIGVIRGTTHSLVERNTIYYAGEQVTGYPKVGIQIAAEKNIVRNNLVVKTSARPFRDDGIGVFAYHFNGLKQNARHNRVYNNVVYKSGRAALAMNQKGSAVNSHNEFLNNIFYYNRVGGPAETYWPDGNYYLTVETYHARSNNKWPSFPNHNRFHNNLMLHADASGDHPNEDSFVYYDQEGWGRSLAWVQANYPAYFANNISRNPLFANAEEGDFRLRAGSPAIDAGAHLAKTTASGASTTTVPVDDPYFFADGFGVVWGDFVRIGSNAPVRITGVDYGDRTLTVETPVSFRAGDPVDLPYSGAAPDIGAFEHS